MSAESNAAVRERRKNDPAFRQRQLENKARHLQRKKLGLVAEAAPQRRKPKEGPWFEDWLRLNSEDPEVVALAKRNCKHRMDVMVAMTIKACASDEPRKEKAREEPEESFGLGDDY